MEPVANIPPLIVIVGQTASGKSALAMNLARRFNGEIIAADSRTVYRGMDIGTAKPTPQDQEAVPHHLIDVASPDERFTAADFQKLAQQAINSISKRKKIPILVGGTGLYVDSILYNFSFRQDYDPAKRAKLADVTIEELQQILHDRAIPLPENSRNPRHLIRAIETNGAPAIRNKMRANTLILAIEMDRQVLRQRIADRVDTLMQQGLVDEIRILADKYGWNVDALQAPAYKAFRSYLEGDSTIEEAKQQFIQNDIHYAKRQKTWFKRNHDIHWISKAEDAVDLVTTFLNK